MDAFLVVSVFGTVGLALSVLAGIIWVNSSEYEMSGTGMLSSISAIILLTAGLFANLPIGPVVSTSYEDTASYELSPLSAMSFSNSELRGGNGDEDVYAYLCERGGYEKDAYCLVIPKEEGSIEYRLVYTPMKTTAVEDIASGETPYVTVRAKHTSHASLFGHEVGGFPESEYVLHIDEEALVTGENQHIYQPAKKL